MDRLSELTERMRALELRSDFLKYCQMLLRHGGDLPNAALEAATASNIPARVSRILRSAMEGGGTTDAGWASELAEYRVLTSEWMNLLSSRTLLGRLPFRRAAFNTRTLKETTSGDAAWVAEGAAIPVSKLSLDDVTLDDTKIAGLVVFTEESVRSTTPAALANINAAMLRTIGRYSDSALLDPAVAAVTGTNPASLTSGISPIESTGSTEAAITANLKTMLQAHVDAGADLQDVQIVMHPMSALHMSTLLTAGNVRAYPNLGVRGGEVFGVPVQTSVGAEASGSPSERVLVAINPQGILLADDGDIVVAASRHGAIQQDNAPSGDSAAGTGSTVVSLMQANAVALRFIRRVNFARAFDGAVSYMRVLY